MGLRKQIMSHKEPEVVQMGLLGKKKMKGDKGVWNENRQHKQSNKKLIVENKVYISTSKDYKVNNILTDPCVQSHGFAICSSASQYYWWWSLDNKYIYSLKILTFFLYELIRHIRVILSSSLIVIYL